MSTWSPKVQSPRRTTFVVLLSRTIWFLCWLYLFVVVLAWGCLRYGADRHWLGTLLEFGPRWVLLVPLAPLALGATIWNWRLWWIIGAVLIVVLGPVWGLSLPWSAIGFAKPTALQLRVLTLNTDGRADPSAVLALVEESQVDVVFLQECRRPELWVKQFGPEWHVLYEDEFVVAAKYPLTDLEPLSMEDQVPWDRCAVRCQVSTTLGSVHLVNLHTYSPRKGLEAVRHRENNAIGTLQKNIMWRRKEALAISAWTASLRGPMIIAGDFNQAAGSTAYEDCWGRYANAFSESGLGWGATFYSRWHGVRIDHVLISDDWQARECWSARHVGSAHRPVIATLQARRAEGSR